MSPSKFETPTQRQATISVDYEFLQSRLPFYQPVTKEDAVFFSALSPRRESAWTCPRSLTPPSSQSLDSEAEAEGDEIRFRRSSEQSVKSDASASSCGGSLTLQPQRGINKSHTAPLNIRHPTRTLGSQWSFSTDSDSGPDPAIDAQIWMASRVLRCTNSDDVMDRLLEPSTDEEECPVKQTQQQREASMKATKEMLENSRFSQTHESYMPALDYIFDLYAEDVSVPARRPSLLLRISSTSVSTMQAVDNVATPVPKQASMLQALQGSSRLDPAPTICKTNPTVATLSAWSFTESSKIPRSTASSPTRSLSPMSLGSPTYARKASASSMSLPTTSSNRPSAAPMPSKLPKSRSRDALTTSNERRASPVSLHRKTASMPTHSFGTWFGWNKKR